MLFFVMMFTSTGPPRDVMGEAMGRVGDVLPLTHVVVAMQDPWLGFGSNAGALTVVAAVTVTAGLAAIRAFRWD